MSLIFQRTKWVLFLSSSAHEPEVRHILDLVFGLMCLERAGILQSDIFIYVDGPEQSIASLFAVGSAYPYQIKRSEDFFTDVPANLHDNLVMFVTGHGSPQGIDAAIPITPNKLISAIKNMANLNHAIVYLGQCYAGLFNYVNASRERIGERLSPEVILIGATNLHESLSSPTTEQFGPQSIPWLANIFLLHVFKWISLPTDIDGDGRNTVMDSYKYAGVHSNVINKQYKANGFIAMLDLHQKYKELHTLVLAPTGDASIDLNNQVNFQAAHDRYQNSLAVHYVHQECWILNSIPAQRIEF